MGFDFSEYVQRIEQEIQALSQKITSHIRIMSAIKNRVAAVIAFLQSSDAELKAELADVKSQLAEALANDAADAEAIAAAQAAAEAAQAAAEAAQSKVAELQALADADMEEDAAIEAILDSVAMPEPEPTPEV